VFQNAKQLKANWLIKNNILSFEVENYDPNIELIIDPVTRLWGTYYGSTGDEYGQGCATDVFGNIYLSGHTSTGTSTIIATNGGYQTVYGGFFDAFLVKFNPAGSR